MGQEITLQTTKGQKYLGWIRHPESEIFDIMNVEHECGEVIFSRDQINNILKILNNDTNKYSREIELLSKAENFYSKEGYISIIFE